MKMRVRKIAGLSSKTSSLWFIDDESIEEFMKERYFRRQADSEAGLSFAPTNGIEVYIYIHENTLEYKMVLGFSDGEVAVDVGKVNVKPDLGVAACSIHLSGTYLEDCEVTCER